MRGLCRSANAFFCEHLQPLCGIIKAVRCNSVDGPTDERAMQLFYQLLIVAVLPDE
jgi:hypothetical protein